MSPPLRYDAFLSYSHAADDRLAPALQKGLHRLARKWYALRAMRTFRDKTGLAATPELWPDIERALRDSRCFILLASPEAARSTWVRREVEWWTKNREPKTLFVALTNGDIRWTSDGSFDPEVTTALPPELARYFNTEPGHVDLRWARKENQLSLRHSRFREAVVDLAAPIHGIPDKADLDSEDVRQHRLFKLAAWSTGVALLLLTMISFFAAWQAIQNAREAKEQRKTAEARLADRYWDESRAARASGRHLEALLWNAEALALQPEQATAEALLLDRAALMPSATLAEVVTHTGVKGARFDARNQHVLAWGGDGARLWPIHALQRPPAFFGHDKIAGALLSPDGTRLVTWAESYAFLWDVAARRRITAVFHQNASIRRVEFSPDGLLFLSQSNGGVIVRRTADGRAVGGDFREELRLAGASFSHDGTRMVTWGYPSASLWDAYTGALLKTFPHDDWVVKAVLSPDASRLFTATRDWPQRGSLWSTDARQIRRVPIGGDEGVLGGAFAPSGSSILTWSLDGTASLWSAMDGASIRAMPHENVEEQGGVSGAVFRPDGSQFATWALDGVRVWDAAGESLEDIPDAAAARYTDDGRFLLTWNGDAVQIWDANRLEPAGPALFHSSWTSVAATTDGRYLLTAGSDGTVRLWAGAVLPAPGSVDRFPNPLLSPDGKQLLTWSNDHKARLWDFESSREKAVLDHTLVHGGTYSPDGKRVLTWGYRDAILWNAETGGQVRVLDHGSRPDVGDVRAVFSGTGERIASWSGDSIVRLWEGVTGAPLGRVSHKRVEAVVFDASGARFATWGDDSAVRLWDAATRRSLAVLRHGSRVNGVMFRRDGARILTWSADGSARLWDLDSGTLVRSFRHATTHPKSVVRADLSADARTVVTSGADQVTKLWSATSGEQLASVRHPTGESRSVANSGAVLDPSRERMLTWGTDGTARLWDVAQQRESIPALQHFGVTGARFVHGGTRVLTWGGGSARLWDARTGGILGAPFTEACVKTFHDEARLLTCDASLRWRPCAGCTTPPDQVKRELARLTGTALDPATGTIRTLGTAQWKILRRSVP